MSFLQLKTTGDSAAEYTPPPRDRIFWLTHVLYLFNIIVFMSGIACMGLAAWVLATTAYLTALLRFSTSANMPSLLQQCSFVLLFAGIVLFIVAIIGICAVYMEQVKIIRIYTAALILIIVLELTVAIVVSLFQDKMKHKLRLALYRSLDDEYVGTLNTTNRFTLSLDWAMVTFECCGVEGFADFKTSLWKHSQKEKGSEIIAEVPDTCCKYVDKSFYPTAPDKLKFVDRKCPVYPTDENSWRSSGCYKKLQHHARWYINIITAVGWSMLITQVLGVICSLLLAMFISQRKELYDEVALGKISLEPFMKTEQRTLFS